VAVRDLGREALLTRFFGDNSSTTVSPIAYLPLHSRHAAGGLYESTLSSTAQSEDHGEDQ
jgi:hypothetical protein